MKFLDFASNIFMRRITNSSGTFWVDQKGVLRKFKCAEENFFKPLDDPNYRKENHLEWLEIPEGVTALPAGTFDGYEVFAHIKLPDSLTALGDSTGGVFRHCHCSKLEVSKGITFVAEDSFFLSSIGTIQISDDMDTLAVQKLVNLFRNHTYHYFLFSPVEKIRDLPPLQVPTIQLSNESGSFYVDKLGVLQSFCCSPENNADTCSAHDTKKLYTLHIPEGVTVLKEDAFRGYTIFYKMTLPDSLRLMGTGHGCVFAECNLPDVVIPEKLKIMGTFAFGHGTIRSLRLPENETWEYARQFKHAGIGTLYLSKKRRRESIDSNLCEHIDANNGCLGSIKANDVQIGEIVWLE